MAKNKLNNMLTFDDFSGELPLNKQKKTKRTEVGLDVLNENAEVIQAIAAVVNDAGFMSQLNSFVNELTPKIKAELYKILNKKQ